MDLRLKSSLGFTAFLTLGYATIETRRPGGASTTFSAQGQTVAVGADAAFALPAFYEVLERQGVRSASPPTRSC